MLITKASSYIVSCTVSTGLSQVGYLSVLNKHWEGISSILKISSNPINNYYYYPKLRKSNKVNYLYAYALFYYSNHRYLMRYFIDYHTINHLPPSLCVKSEKFQTKTCCYWSNFVPVISVLLCATICIYKF